MFCANCSTCRCVFLMCLWEKVSTTSYSSTILILPPILCLLIGAFSPLIFKIIIDTYVFIAILNFIFQLIICFSFVPFIFLVVVVGWFPFILFLYPLLFCFCECVVCFLFVVALFSSLFLFLYMLSLAWQSYRFKHILKKGSRFSYFPSPHFMILMSFF